MSINIGIFDINNKRVFTPDILFSAPTVDKSTNGPRSCTFTISTDFRQAVMLYAVLLGKEVRVNDNGAIFFKGRIEDVKIKSTGLEITAFGYWRALDDILYTSIWSTTLTQTWRKLEFAEFAFAVPEMYDFSFQNMINISPRKNGVFTGSFIAFAIWIPPDQQIGTVAGIQFDYAFLAPVDWVAGCQKLTSALGSATNLMTPLAGSAALQTGTVCVDVAGASASDVIVLFMYYGGGTLLYTGENGASYFRVTNIRIVRSTTYKVNTTYGGFGGGLHTVGTTAGMYVGQRVHFSQQTVRGESGIITAINSSTQITVSLAKAHNVGDAVQAHQIYANEIVSDIITQVNNQNSSQINTATPLIRSSNIDLIEYTFADQRPSEILNLLASLGDNASPPNLFEVGVDCDKLVYFRPRGYVGQVYYVDISDIETVLTLSTIYNDIYGTYINTSLPFTVPGGGIASVPNYYKARTAKSADQTSINFIGLKRTNSIDANTSIIYAANTQRDTTLNDQKTTQAKASVVFEKVFNLAGGSVPLGLINPGDTFIIRNFPFTLVSTSVIDRLKSFRLLEVSYDVANNKLSVTPENFIPTLGTMLRQRQLLGNVARRI